MSDAGAITMGEVAPLSAPALPSPPRTGLVAELRGAASSLTFLTRLPLGTPFVLDAEDLARSAPYFPLVGAGIGGVVALVALGVSSVAGPLLAAVGAVALYVGLTGALHLDGVADTFDGLGTNSREKALSVMREPTIGTFGATALFLVLFLWAALLATLVGRPAFLDVLVVVGALSRLGPVLLLVALPYARPEGGTGTGLSRGSKVRAGVAVGIALGLAILLLGFPGLLITAVLLLALAGLGTGFRRWLGGVTGDTLGCSIEILSILGLAAALVLLLLGVLR
jgi:adenosylcobinamide-GDP ribazoletransferase